MSKITFDISTGSDEDNNLSFPQRPEHDQNTSFIDEIGLLPGTPEPRAITGALTISSETQHVAQVKFEPIHEQHSLLDPMFKSHGKDLHYTLSHDNQILTATAGPQGPMVFTAELNNHGGYTFTLHDHIDREAPPNLLPTEYELSLRQTLDDPVPTQISLNHDVITQHNAPYQLALYYKPEAGISEINPIHIYWDNQLLHTLYPTEHEERGYIFSVDGSPEQDMTRLQFVGIPNEDYFKDHFHDISIISMAQHKLPLDIGFSTIDALGNTLHNHFTVNVTTTPAIELTNQDPLNVMYDQGVYQTIIVNEENFHNNPLTTINLDTLFNHLAIPTENRLVEIVQREENGLATNVYEVKISDKSEHLEPITVADVQLSFPGGNGGLSVFQRNIFIDEGSNNILLHDQHIV